MVTGTVVNVVSTKEEWSVTVTSLAIMDSVVSETTV